MAILGIVNLCNLILSLAIWHSHKFDRDYLPHLLSYLLVSLLSWTLFVNSMSGRRDYGRSLYSVGCNVLVLLPLYVLLQYLGSIYVHTLDWKLVLYNSILLSILTTYPNVSMVNYIFGRGNETQFILVDKLIMYNFVSVISLSWFFAFAYGLDGFSEIKHYPVASCIGAIIGSIVANFCGVVHYLFDNYNTLFVY